MATGGYDVEFVEPLDKDYECPICKLALRDPVQTCCGHTSCSMCFHLATRPPDDLLFNEEGQDREGEFHEDRDDEDDKDELQCPLCKQMIPPDKVFDDTRLKRKVLSLKVRCINKKLETPDDQSICNWSGELGYYQNHLRLCDYEIVPCSNDCGEQCQRVKLNNHLLHACIRRIISCSHCDADMERRQLETHLTVCPKLPLPCELACGQNVCRETMKAHISETGDCPNTIVPCLFKDVGCIMTCKRCELDQHMVSSVVQHQKLQHDTMMKQEQTMATHIQFVTEQISHLTNENNELRRKLQQKDKAMTWLHSSVCQLFQQLSSEASMLSTCGHALVRLNIKQQDGFYESPPFQAHKSGYMATLNVYHTAYETVRGRRMRMCVGLHLARSKNDRRLEWPFKKRHLIALFDQRAKNGSHHYKVVDPRTLDDSLLDYCFNKPGSLTRPEVSDELFTLRAQHAMLCIPQSDLYTPNYVKNDTIVIEVQIDD